MELQQVNELLLRDVESIRSILKSLKDLAKDYALAEKDYQIAKSRAVLELKAAGQAATLIPDIVRGKDNVADLRFARDVAKEVYHVNKIALHALQTNLTVYQSILRHSDEV